MYTNMMSIIIAMRYKIHSDKVRLAIEGQLRVINIPDDEVDCRIDENKTAYTYSSGIPFGGLRVNEYYEYQTSLAGDKAFCMEKAFEVVGFRGRGDRLMRRLNVREYRQIQVAVRLRNDVGGVITDIASKRMFKTLAAHGYRVETRGQRIENSKRVSKRKLDKILTKRGLCYLTLGT